MRISFEVKQEKGSDSLVSVEEDVIIGYPDDKQVLIFHTDQSLFSNSDRAWQVENAIKIYADERGYKVQKSEKYQVIAIYSPEYHSRMLEYKLRCAVKEHRDFLETAEVAKNDMVWLDEKYGRHILELKQLVFLLEEKLDNKLKQVAASLIKKQKEIISDLDTSGIDARHLSSFDHPLIEIKRGYTYKTTTNIPDNLATILNLL